MATPPVTANPIYSDRSLTGWIDWLSERVDAPTVEARRAGALTVIATIDGLLLLRRAAGVDVADEAAVALG